MSTFSLPGTSAQPYPTCLLPRHHARVEGMGSLVRLPPTFGNCDGGATKLAGPTRLARGNYLVGNVEQGRLGSDKWRNERPKGDRSITRRLIGGVATSAVRQDLVRRRSMYRFRILD